MGSILMTKNGKYIVESTRTTHGGMRPSFSVTEDINKASFYLVPEPMIRDHVKEFCDFIVLEAEETRTIELVITPATNKEKNV